MTTQAVRTRFVGATRILPARVYAKISDEASIVTVPYNDALSLEENHLQALREYLKRNKQFNPKGQGFECGVWAGDYFWVMRVI
jgi:hypothetical protein